MPKSIGRTYIKGVAFFILISLWVGPLQAAFVLVEDFEGLSPGSIDGQNGWRAPGGSGAVVMDPMDSGNQVLAVTTESNYLSKDAAILNGTVRMLFLRFRIANQLNFSFGMSDAAIPNQFGDFESELGLRNSTNDLRINDDGMYEVLITLLPNIWYNLWMLVDNDIDTTTVWLNDIPGAEAVATDILANDAGTTVFEFRNGGTSSPLRTFFIKTGGGNSENSGPLYIDDLYLEDTDALNLWNPTFCEGDFDEDGDVDGGDLYQLITDFSLTGAGFTEEQEFDENAELDPLDIAVFAANFGRANCQPAADDGGVSGR